MVRNALIKVIYNRLPYKMFNSEMAHYKRLTCQVVDNHSKSFNLHSKTMNFDGKGKNNLKFRDKNEGEACCVTFVFFFVWVGGGTKEW